jgi:hypothetical protein
VSVLDVLRRGRANAIRKQDIARRLGRPTRLVEREIEELRKSGQVAICSDSQVGYWLPLSAAEYAVNLRARRVRALHQLQTNRGERRALRSLEVVEAGPLSLWG